MFNRTRLGLGMAGLLFVFASSLRAEDGVKLVGEKNAVGKLIAADIDLLKKALSAPKPEKKDQKRARVLAVVIGLNAQAVGNDESKAIFEQVYKVAHALAQEDGLADAKKAVAAVGVSKSPTGEKTGDIVKFLFDEDPTVKDWDRDLAMQLFKTPRAGGLGFESKIKDWSESAPKAAKDLETAAGIAQRTAVIGMALEKMTAPKKSKPGTDWKKYSQDLQAASADALKAAGSKDSKALQASLARMDQACTVCHEKTK
jgi:hypothetical protein